MSTVVAGALGVAALTAAPPVDTVPPGLPLVAGSALLSLLLAVVAGWLVESIVVVVHEGSHALTAGFLGIPVRSVKIGAREGETSRGQSGMLVSVRPSARPEILGASFGLGSGVERQRYGGWAG